MSQITHQLLHTRHGQRVALAQLPFSECVSLAIYLPVGSRHEARGQEGIAHFIEHMVFKGTTRRDARQISLDAEGAGGQLNAFTSEDHTAYEARGPAEIFPLLAEILADLVWNPTFPNTEIDRERDVILDEILTYRESPADHIGDLASKAMWGSHPLGHPITGSEESLANMNRERLLEFSNIHYRSPQAVIAVAGPLGAAEVLRMLDTLIPAPSAVPAPAPVPFDLANFHPHELVERRRDTEQCQLSLGYHTPGRSAAERHALRLLSLILGEPMSSRLFQELREMRGLCYQVSTDVSLFAETGTFEISLATDPQQRAACLAIIEEQIQQLAQHGPSEAELAAAKRFAAGQSRLAFESSAAHMAWVAEALLFHDRLVPIDEARANLEEVTAQQVQQAAAAFLTPLRRATAVITP